MNKRILSILVKILVLNIVFAMVFPAYATTKADINSAETKLLFKNSDFEMGTLENWKTSGSAFKFQPVFQDNPTARKRNQPSHHQGDYWVGTYEKYQGHPGQKPGAVQGDRPEGSLTSVPFLIREDKISFLIGGGSHIDTEYVALLVDNEEVRKTTPRKPPSETLRVQTWDVIPFKGKSAQIVIEDDYSRGWGHINADYFHYGNALEDTVENFDLTLPPGYAEVTGMTTEQQKRLASYLQQVNEIEKQGREQGDKVDAWFCAPLPGWRSDVAYAIDTPGETGGLLQRNTLKDYYSRDRAHLEIQVASQALELHKKMKNIQLTINILTNRGLPIVKDEQEKPLQEKIIQQGFDGILTIRDKSVQAVFILPKTIIRINYNKRDPQTVRAYIKGLDLNTADTVFGL